MYNIKVQIQRKQYFWRTTETPARGVFQQTPNGPNTNISTILIFSSKMFSRESSHSCDSVAKCFCGNSQYFRGAYCLALFRTVYCTSLPCVRAWSVQCRARAYQWVSNASPITSVCILYCIHCTIKRFMRESDFYLKIIIGIT